MFEVNIMSLEPDQYSQNIKSFSHWVFEWSPPAAPVGNLSGLHSGQVRSQGFQRLFPYAAFPFATTAWPRKDHVMTTYGRVRSHKTSKQDLAPYCCDAIPSYAVMSGPYAVLTRSGWGRVKNGRIRNRSKSGSEAPVNRVTSLYLLLYFSSNKFTF